MRHRGQISIFLILAIILILGSIAAYYIYTSTKEKQAQTEATEQSLRNAQAEQLKSFFEECVRKTAYEGLKLIGAQGGYVSIPPSLDAGGVAYWQHQSANIQPFLNETQEELISYLEQNVPSCVDDNSASAQGFSLRKGDLDARAEFGDNDVSVIIHYPLTLTQDEFSASYAEFTERIQIPYRRIFETATELNKHILLPQFDPITPLKGAKEYGFSLEYQKKGDEAWLFRVIDRKDQTPDGIPYTFSFAATLGLSSLKKRTMMQNLSVSQPTPYGYHISSPDNKAILFIDQGITISQGGSDVSYIDVLQEIDDQVITSSVPTAKRNDQIVGRGDLTYVTGHRIYNFEPSGLIFSQPQKLTINYDDNGNIAGGVGMLQGHNGFWFPIRSFDDPQNRQVSAYIAGFTDFTAVDCATQPKKTVSAEHYKEPSAICYVSLAITIASFASFASGFIGSQMAAAEAAALSEAASTAALAGNFDVAATLSAQAAEIQAAAGGSMFFTPAEAYGTNIMRAASSVGINIGLSASTVGLIAYGISAVSMIGFVAGLVDPNIFYDDAPQNCQTYIPTCAQKPSIKIEETDGEGKCMPEGIADLGAGQPATLCAQVEKCNMVNSFLCMPCSVKCTVEYT